MKVLTDDGVVTLWDKVKSEAQLTKSKVENVLTGDITTHTHSQYALGTSLSDEVARAKAEEASLQKVIDVINGASTVDGSFRKAIADLIGGAPESLDTLKEIADKLADDDDLHKTIEEAIAKKADKATTLGGYGITDAYTQAEVKNILASYLTTEVAKKTYQPIGNYLTEHQDISGKSDKTHTHSVKINGNTKTIAATGGEAVDLGTYLTAHQSLDGYVNDVTVSGDGNAVTEVAKSGKKVTITKGKTFLTEHQDISGKADVSDLTAHTSDKSNPHEVTKEQVGLGNVDNTSDANKPVSTATQEALDLKLDKSYLEKQLFPTFTLEESSNPEFTVTGTVALENYLAKVGGYMLLLKDGVAYAAKLKSTDWNYFEDGTAVDDAGKYETMVYLPTCHFLSTGKTMMFLGEANGGNSFASPNWVGAYEMYVDSDGKGHSWPDVSPSHSKTMSAFWNCAQSTGTDFGLANYQFHCLINTLFQAKYGNLNSQSAIGSGGQTGSWETWRDVLMGYGRTLGDGCGTASTSMDGQNCVKLFGFEDLWAKLWEFRPGIRFYYKDGKRYAVVYDGNKVSNTEDGRTFEIPLLNAGGAFVTQMTLGDHWDMMPKAVGGGATTGYCDGYWDSQGGQLLVVGGCAYVGSRCGLSSADSARGFSASWTDFGARLAFYGTPIVISGAELAAM